MRSKIEMESAATLGEITKSSLKDRISARSVHFRSEWRIDGDYSHFFPKRTTEPSLTMAITTLKSNRKGENLEVECLLPLILR